MRRFLLNILALTPVILFGYDALPVLLDPTRRPVFHSHLIALATHPYAKPIFITYMAAFFAVALVPVIYQQIRQAILRYRLRQTSRKKTVAATIMSIHNSGIRIQSGYYVRLKVRIPDGRTINLYTEISPIRHLAVGDTVQVTYDPNHIKRAILTEK